MSGNDESRADYGTPYLGIRREIADDVHWLCGCLEMSHNGAIVHSYVAPYLVIGSERTLMVDTGHPAHWDTVSGKLRALLGSRTLDFVFPTHPEMPHAGNLTRLLKEFPDCRIVGDMRDLHLYFPDMEDSFVMRRAGEALELGGRTFSFHEAIIRDLTNTLWGFDDKSRVLFVSDGFGFAHYHGVGDCGALAEELNEISTEQVSFLNDAALSWVRHTDLRPILARVELLARELDVRVIAPAHGAVAGDAEVTLPRLVGKLLEGRELVPASAAAEAGTTRP